MLVLGAFLGLILYLTPFQGSEFGQGGSDKFKFEIKKAKDVEQRLDDVKGIEEIRNEIQDLIKMIKNSNEYRSKGA